jgi:hypothetical protein
VSRRLDISAFTGWDRDRRPSAGERERERRDFRRAHPDLLVRTETVVLSPVALREPKIVDRAREDLVARLQRWCDQTGREVWQVSWSTDPPIDGSMLSALRLEAATVHRTDGEWPALHRAMAEDEADREAARRERAENPVHGRLDALRAGAAYWGDRRLRGL